MLYKINPILSPDILKVLRAMGHGDTIVIADANFPAHSSGVKTIRLDGVSATDTLTAVLDILPLDTFVETPLYSMQIVDKPNVTPEIVNEFQSIANKANQHHKQADVTIKPLERFDFYDVAKNAYCVIQTGETRLYGNIIIQKGVIGKNP